MEAPAINQRHRVDLRHREAQNQGHKGAGNRRAALAMAYKLYDAQARWRRLDGQQHVALVRAGAVFIDGQLQERNDTDQPNPEDVAA